MSIFNKRFGMGSSLEEVARNVAVRDAEKLAKEAMQAAAQTSRFTERRIAYMVAKKASQLACEGTMDKQGRIATVQAITEAAKADVMSSQKGGAAPLQAGAVSSAPIKKDAGGLRAIVAALGDTICATMDAIGITEKAEQALSALSALGKHGVEELVLSMLESVEREMYSRSPDTCATQAEPALAEKGIVDKDHEEGLKFINTCVRDLLDKAKEQEDATAATKPSPAVANASVKQKPKKARTLEDIMDLYDAAEGLRYKTKGGNR